MVISSRKFENFELFCPLGAIKLGVQQKKLPHLIQPSQDPTNIYFLRQESRVRVETGRKSEKVCVCVRAFYIWGIDAIKFLWRSGEGVGGWN